MREDWLRATRYIDRDSAAVRDFTARALGARPPEDEAARVARLFEAVRDGIRYDPYSVSFDADDYRAGAVLGQESAFCIPKSIALTACLRAAGIPAAAGFADVRNHLNSRKLSDLMGTDTFFWHGYVQVRAAGREFKITPAFDMGLCERFGVKPLVFDGSGDALFHEFDAGGRRHMEYVNDRGLFDEPPVEEILACYRAAYPGLHALAAGRPADPAFAPDPSPGRA
jgi:transglutaminase-like putative cysteine protease